MKQVICRATYEKLSHKLLCGVALTEKQLSKASEELFFYFDNTEGKSIIPDIVLKTRISPSSTVSWMETREGKKLDAYDMLNLIHRIKC